MTASDNEYPTDGSTFTTVDQIYTQYRWREYKPAAQKQLKKKGRWQRCVWRGDFFNWESCPEGPSGKIVDKIKNGKVQLDTSAVYVIEDLTAGGKREVAVPDDEDFGIANWTSLGSDFPDINDYDGKTTRPLVRIVAILDIYAPQPALRIVTA